MANEDKFLPKKFSTTDDQEDDGNLILENLVKDNAAIKLRLGGNDKTPNRDGFVELRNKTHVIGKLEVQVKPVDPRRTERPCYQVDASLVGYSRVAGLPFILICYDRKNNLAYWKRIDDSIFAGATEKQKSITIDFATDEGIGAGFPYSDRWLRILNDHLEILKLADKFRSALTVVQSRSGDSFPGLLDSPEAFGKVIQQLIDTSTEKFRARLEEAQKLFHQSEIAAATKIVSELEKEIAGENTDKELLLNVRLCLGNCLVRLEQFSEAEACFRSALEVNDSSSKAQANLAHVLYIRNKSKPEALELSERAYKFASDNEFVVSIHFLCLSFNGQRGTVDKLLKERDSIISRSSGIQMAVAQICKESEDYLAARKFCARAIELDPTNVHIRILLAETIYQAIRVHTLALLDKDSLPDAEQSKADIDAAISEIDIAIAKLILTTDRIALSRAYELRALLNMIKGDFDAGITDCDKMVALVPDSKLSKIIKAQLFTQVNRFEEAIKVLEPLSTDSTRTVQQVLAYSYYKLSLHAEAAKFFTLYIEDSDSDQEWIAYIQSLWFAGDKKRAYQSALTLRKAGRAPLVIMREVELKRLFELQEWAGALDVLEDLVKAEPTNAEHWLNRLAMNMNLGKRAKAVELYAALPRPLIESDGWALPRLRDLEQGLRSMHWIQ